jgi:phenylalanyl-tRNA synthetase beta chain
MRISHKWLQKYIDLNASIDELSLKLTSLGLEVEAVEDQGAALKGFSVGEVLDVQKHPNADRLKVCSVRVGAADQPLQIVCGAPNVAAGQKVIVGLAGATVPHNQHDPHGKPFVLSNATIRGVESKGMICSAKELGIGEDGSGIYVLPSDAPVGTPVATYLGLDDVAFEIGITPNRPDCLSHIGIARDLAAVYGTKLKMPVVSLKENSTPIESLTSVRVENTADCPRYTARIIRNVTVKESPEWMQRLLKTAGLRPINNVVDITNFVMMEFGQPLHAFDFSNLAGKRIVVKSAAPGEIFITLDGRSHTLAGDELMICDGERSVAIGGVMGGMNSEISASTTTVLLEAAYFSPTSVRRTAKRLGISTDASYRFERGIDPNITEQASARAAQLIAEISGAEIVSGLIDVYPSKIKEKELVLRVDRVNKLLGTSLTPEGIRQYLASIGINVTASLDKKMMHCIIPTFRPDIEQEIDLVEEVARLFGYDNIDNKTSSEVMFSKPDAAEMKISELRKWLESNGLNEVMTNSLIESGSAKLFSQNTITVKNPLSQELEVLRPNLAATMLQSVAYNYNHGADRLQIFEIGSTFTAVEPGQKKKYVEGYSESNVLGICLSGYANDVSWHEKRRKVDIFDLKGIVLSLLNGIGLDNSNLIYYNAPSSLTEMTIGIEINGTYVGFIGRCNTEIVAKYKIDQEVFYAELDVDALVGFDATKKYKEFSRYPTVVRDLAFIVPSKSTTGEIEKEIWSSGGTYISSVTLFDVFEGKSLGEGKKSIAFSISLNSHERTLADADIDAVMNAVINAVTKRFEATLRSL